MFTIPSHGWFMTLFYPYGYISCLVVSTPLKNMKVRLDHHPNYWGKKHVLGMVIPNIWKVIKTMFQTTNQT